MSSNKGLPLSHNRLSHNSNSNTTSISPSINSSLHYTVSNQQQEQQLSPQSQSSAAIHHSK